MTRAADLRAVHRVTPLLAEHRPQPELTLMEGSGPLDAHETSDVGQQRNHALCGKVPLLAPATGSAAVAHAPLHCASHVCHEQGRQDCTIPFRGSCVSADMMLAENTSARPHLNC